MAEIGHIDMVWTGKAMSRKIMREEVGKGRKSEVRRVEDGSSKTLYGTMRQVGRFGRQDRPREAKLGKRGLRRCGGFGLARMSLRRKCQESFGMAGTDGPGSGWC